MPQTLSIVIPSHNRPDLLQRSLASVTEHAPPGTEVLVVDDASVGAVVSQTASSFPSVRVLRLAHNRGFCAAVNAGIAATCGQIVELLNDDTEVTAGWAEAALAQFVDPSVGAITPLVLFGPPGMNDSQRVDSAGDHYHPAGIAGKRGHGEVLRDKHLRAEFVFGASGSSSFFRREALLQAGGFPEELVAYFDDIDLSFRLHRAGYRVWYEPGSRVYHRVSASYGKPRRDLLALQSRNEELVYWRNLPAGILLRWLPAHLGVVVAKAVRRAWAGELGPFLRGRLSALLEVPAVIRHRRRVAEKGFIEGALSALRRQLRQQLPPPPCFLCRLEERP
jgi:GT2 family glycosyltransferase